MKHTLLPFLALLGSCDPPGERDTGVPMDWDADGWYGHEDCDNRDYAIHPGAEEICDGLDNDCDGDIDEGFEDSRPWYADADGDGYGDAMVRARHCDPPHGYVEDHSDCDDDDPTIHPGADDAWYDGVDSDCDGGDDLDADGDGHAWEGAGGDDCDDEDDEVFPGALDWRDERDQDCDGVVDASPLAGRPGLLQGAYDEGLLGAALLSVPDQDGDGEVDLVVGSPGVGAAWLIDGPLTEDATLPNAASARLWGESLDSRAGSALAWIGDCDGDGAEELLVGSWLATAGRGAATLVPTPITGDVTLADSAWRVEGAQSGDWLGYAVAGLGDVDDDGFDDLLLGARGVSDIQSQAGAAWLLRGTAAGPQPLGEGARIVGTRERDFAGCAVAGPGDVDGDGLPDLLVGARGEDSGGGAYLFLDAPRGELPLAEAAGQLHGEEPYDYAGWALAGAGDVNGDGLNDILVGAYGRDDGWLDACGGAYLIHGRGREAWTALSSLSQAEVSWLGERAGDHAGWSVASPGDVDGDGRPDLVVGAPGSDLGEDDSGTVYLLLDIEPGGADLNEAALRLYGEAGAQAGWALAATGDHDGDGLPDLLLGLPERGEQSQGAVQVVGLSEP